MFFFSLNIRNLVDFLSHYGQRYWIQVFLHLEGWKTTKILHLHPNFTMCMSLQGIQLKVYAIFVLFHVCSDCAHFGCKSKIFEGQNYLEGKKCLKVEGEWMNRMNGHLFGKVITFGGRSITFMGPFSLYVGLWTPCWIHQKILARVWPHLFFWWTLGCMVLVLGHGSKSFVKWEIITDVVTSDKASHQIM